MPDLRDRSMTTHKVGDWSRRRREKAAERVWGAAVMGWGGSGPGHPMDDGFVWSGAFRR
jgi:hypothetical protein